MDLTQNTDQNWNAIAEMLPADRDQSARQTGAFTRPREIKSSDHLLRLIFFYAWADQSLRNTAAAANETGLGGLSDVALLKRFKKAGPWIQRMIGQILNARIPPPVLPSFPYRIRIQDATILCLQNSKGIDYRLHTVYALLSQTFDTLELTDVSGGETFKRIPVEAGDLFLGDRAYANRGGIAHILQHRAQVLVRFSWNHLPLQTEQGDPFDLIGTLQGLKPGAAGEWSVQTAPDPDNTLPAFRGRVVALPRSKEETKRARLKATQEAQRKGRQVMEETLVSCGYILLFTSLSREEADRDLISNLYRFRWQIECVFKQLKSQLHLDEIKARDPKLVSTFVLCKVLGALLIEDLSACWVSFSPCGP